MSHQFDNIFHCTSSKLCDEAADGVDIEALFMIVAEFTFLLRYLKFLDTIS